MREKIKHALRVVFTILGVIAIFHWIIFPGLSSQNTIINLFSLALTAVISTILGVILWNELNWGKSNSAEENEKEDDNGKIL
jgi:uncharacterized membrane protein